MREVSIIIVGFGKIGRAVARTIASKDSDIAGEFGVRLKVVGICDMVGSVLDEGGIDLGKVAEKPWGKHKDFVGRKTIDVIRSLKADIVVEATPGNVSDGEPGLSHIKAALESGKNVVTSNKAPLVVAFRELKSLARRNGVDLRYEATVGGAIPIINLYESELKPNTINSILGVLNGTTNYILTKMSEEGVEFDAALKEAQNLGLAEPNPEYDVKGIDTAAKVVILSNALLGKNVSLKDVKIVGIDEITPEAVDLAKEYGFEIKLIGDVKNLEVSPRLVPREHPLNIPGNLNAIMLETDIAGPLTLVGAGAGPKETSSSILSDIIAIAKKL